MKIFASLAMLLICNLSSADEYAPQKVIYHINYGDSSRFHDTLTNMGNHIEAVGEDRINLKAIVHGAAIEIFMTAIEDQQLSIAIDAARFNGVQFIICGNTLAGYQITADDLYEVEPDDVVQAGLPEIVKLQQQGYFYVRP